MLSASNVLPLTRQRHSLPMASCTEKILVLSRAAVLALCLSTTACVVSQPVAYVPYGNTNPAPSLPVQQARAAGARFAADCPLPAADTYDHAVQLRPPGEPPAPVTPAIMAKWVDGCAILQFTVDDHGQVDTVQTVSEVPQGVADPAADIIRLNRFANTSGAGAGSPMLIRVGMSRITGGTFVSLGFN